MVQDVLFGCKLLSCNVPHDGLMQESVNSVITISIVNLSSEDIMCVQILLLNAGPFMAEQMPSNSDIIFDCIRVTWVAMIICILFFEMNLASALWTGIITGLAYTLFVRAMYQSQLDVLHREQAIRQGRLQAAGVQPATDAVSPISPLNPQQPQQQHPYVVVV